MRIWQLGSIKRVKPYKPAINLYQVAIFPLLYYGKAN